MTDERNIHDVIIVGAGISGLTAAAYLCKAGYRPLVIEKQDTIGGLVQSFDYRGFVFDSGIRSIESSGVVKPLIRDLGLDVDYRRSTVTLGIKDQVITLSSKEDLVHYESLMISIFPEQKKDIRIIMKKIRRILGYMDILYGIDNPMMMDLKQNTSYVFKTLIPWFFKFIPTLFQIDRLTIPVESYLKRFTDNQSLIDMMIQHFFQATPAFFALGYFDIYFDYHYPQGGTGKLTESIGDYIKSHGGTILLSTSIERIDPENKTLRDHNGNIHAYRQLIWAADLKAMYRGMDEMSLIRESLKGKVVSMKSLLKDKRGAESVLSVYATVDLPPSYFRDRCSEHFFYTPDSIGIHRFPLPDLKHRDTFDESLSKHYEHQTFEISIPSLRDLSLSPEGKTGLIISILMPYDFVRDLQVEGMYESFKSFTEQSFVNILNSTVFPGLKNHIIDLFTSTPLTFEKRNSSTDGAIIGWAYTSKPIPVLHKMSGILSSVKTPFRDIYQSGQWSFSPAGVPISILTGKLASDRVIKHLRKHRKSFGGQS